MVTIRSGSALSIALLCAFLTAHFDASAQAKCPVSYGTQDAAKPNKLYLYFPAADDTTFPAYVANASPARTFDISSLTSYAGTAAALRDAVRDVVIDDYCEFNVQVLTTTTSPPTTFARRNTVAIGTDANGTTWGQAQAVDTGDATISDFARVWAGTYQSTAGGAGGALNGANSTLERWAFSIGGTAAHEAGHSYGLSHADGLVVAAGEDALTRHIMPAGVNISNEQRAGYRRHFSNLDFSTLAANVGLSIQTMHNWDLTNPNSTAANQARITFLSPTNSLIASWSYAGTLSPWINPSLSGVLGTQVFKGTTYNRYQMTWSTGQSWSNGSPGVVPAGVSFHIGATFSGIDFNAPDPIIITRVELLDGSGNALPLSPRLPGYDAGTLDAQDGSLNFAFFNADAGPPLVLSNVVVRELPRVLSIENMVAGAPYETWNRLSFAPWPDSVRSVPLPGRGRDERPQADIADRVDLKVGSLSQARHFYRKVDATGCVAPNDRSTSPDVNECSNAGSIVDLFPSTTIYLTATVVDPAAQHWDPAQHRFVVGPVESRIYYQVAGRHPDLNGNGIDDYLDIQNGTSRDVNHDGVPDEAQAHRRAHWWWGWLALLLAWLAL